MRAIVEKGKVICATDAVSQYALYIVLRYSLQFQAFAGGFGMYPPPIRGPTVHI